MPLISEIAATPHYERTILGGGSVERTLLNQLFFGAKNIDIVQNAVRRGVWLSTDKQALIGRQPDSDLVLAMRTVYFDKARNLPDHIPEQIAELNAAVVKKVLPTILANVAQYRAYMTKVDSPLEPIPRSLDVSSTGTRTLPARLPAL